MTGYSNQMARARALLKLPLLCEWYTSNAERARGPPLVVRADEGGSGKKERRLAVGMMIGPSGFIVGFAERAERVTNARLLQQGAAYS
jgi:hypothetical protein